MLADISHVVSKLNKQILWTTLWGVHLGWQSFKVPTEPQPHNIVKWAFCIVTWATVIAEVTVFVNNWKMSPSSNLIRLLWYSMGCRKENNTIKYNIIWWPANIVVMIVIRSTHSVNRSHLSKVIFCEKGLCAKYQYKKKELKKKKRQMQWRKVK